MSASCRSSWCTFASSSASFASALLCHHHDTTISHHHHRPHRWELALPPHQLALADIDCLGALLPQSDVRFWSAVISMQAPTCFNLSLSSWTDFNRPQCGLLLFGGPPTLFGAVWLTGPSRPCRLGSWNQCTHTLSPHSLVQDTTSMLFDLLVTKSLVLSLQATNLFSQLLPHVSGVFLCSLAAPKKPQYEFPHHGTIVVGSAKPIHIDNTTLFIIASVKISHFCHHPCHLALRVLDLQGHHVRLVSRVVLSLSHSILQNPVQIFLLAQVPPKTLKLASCQTPDKP